ncbi:MAG: hypothetical protein H7318_19980 [Oligoflexus sp.]|nr:hypothetical protein [Oligoflexus sp.]
MKSIPALLIMMNLGLMACKPNQDKGSPRRPPNYTPQEVKSPEPKVKVPTPAEVARMKNNPTGDSSTPLHPGAKLYHYLYPNINTGICVEAEAISDFSGVGAIPDLTAGTCPLPESNDGVPVTLIKRCSTKNEIKNQLWITFLLYSKGKRKIDGIFSPYTRDLAMAELECEHVKNGDDIN